MIETYLRKIEAMHRLMRAQDIDNALLLADELLAQNELSPYLLVTKARLILLLDRTDGPSLEDAEQCLLRAIEINAHDLEAIEELAHLYDVTLPDSTRAASFASLALEQVEKLRADMQNILVDNSK
jgi:hypothetical protein